MNLTQKEFKRAHEKSFGSNETLENKAKKKKIYKEKNKSTYENKYLSNVYRCLIWCQRRRHLQPAIGSLDD